MPSLLGERKLRGCIGYAFKVALKALVIFRYHQAPVVVENQTFNGLPRQPVVCSHPIHESQAVAWSAVMVAATIFVTGYEQGKKRVGYGDYLLDSWRGFHGLWWLRI